MSKNSLLFAILFIVGVFFTCSKPSPIGSGQIEPNLVDVLSTDTLSIIAQSVDEDSILVFESGRNVPTALFGNYTDPFFGDIQASIYTQVRFLNNSRGPDLDSTATLDSVVLILAYDTTSVYGDVEQPQSVEIYRLSETMNSGQSYFSNTTFGTNATPLGSKTNFFPKPYDTLVVKTPTADTIRTFTAAPHLRVRLDDAFGEYLVSLKDSSDIYSDQDAFKERIKGFFIKPTGMPNNHMLAFDLLNSTNNQGLTGLWLYYSQQDTLHRSYRFPITANDARVVNFNQDDEMSLANQFANDPVKGDSLLFIQGMVGKNIRLSFPSAEQLTGIAVNKAQLELTVADLPGDLNKLDASLRIFAYTLGNDGKFQLVDDIVADRNIQSSLTAFDGLRRTEKDDSGMDIQRYHINLSTVFQRIVEGDIDSNIYLRLAIASNFTKEIIPSRSVIYGPKHSKYPLKLELTYTKI